MATPYCGRVYLSGQEIPRCDPHKVLLNRREQQEQNKELTRLRLLELFLFQIVEAEGGEIEMPNRDTNALPDGAAVVVQELWPARARVRAVTISQTTESQTTEEKVIEAQVIEAQETPPSPAGSANHV